MDLFAFHINKSHATVPFKGARVAPIVQTLQSESHIHKLTMKIRSLPQVVIDRAKDFELPENFELVTTLRYDPGLAALTRNIPIALQESFDEKFFLANLHYQRLKQGARVLGWNNIVENFNQQRVFDVLSTVRGDDPLAVRLALNLDGRLSVTTRPAMPRKNLFIGVSNGGGAIPLYKVYLHNEPVPASKLMPLKSNSREIYNKIREKYDLKVDTQEEVIIYNENNELMEGSISSVAVQVGDEWVCPKIEEGGVSSVMRSLLVDLKFIKEGTINKNDLTDGQDVLLFNGVIGVVRGKLSVQ